MRIADVEIKSPVSLAPLAGITDMAFRRVCRDFGAGYCETEMVSARALSFNDKKSLELMTLASDEHPCGIQLFGSEPGIMASAAKIAAGCGADIIDINMGCPAPKIVSNGSGASLMKNPRLCGEIVEAVKNAVDIPVTVKIRKGFDENSVTAVEVSCICEEKGADGIIVHGRTRSQYYSGACDLDIIRKVKESVSVPVIGNGDIKDIQSAERALKRTGCDGLMVARGALGAPWIFKILNTYLETGQVISQPSKEDRLRVMLRHIELVCENKGEHMGILQSRKHMAWYLKGFKGAASLRNEACVVSTLSGAYALAGKALEIQ